MDVYASVLLVNEEGRVEKLEKHRCPPTGNPVECRGEEQEEEMDMDMDMEILSRGSCKEGCKQIALMDGASFPDMEGSLWQNAERRKVCSEARRKCNPKCLLQSQILCE
jgi:hypothetical protein